MISAVGKIFGNIGQNFTNSVNKIDATQSQNFIQAAVSSNQPIQPINLERPESRNSTPYGDSPNGKHLYMLA